MGIPWWENLRNSRIYLLILVEVSSFCQRYNNLVKGFILVLYGRSGRTMTYFHVRNHMYLHVRTPVSCVVVESCYAVIISNPLCRYDFIDKFLLTISKTKKTPNLRGVSLAVYDHLSRRQTAEGPKAMEKMADWFDRRDSAPVN